MTNVSKTTIDLVFGNVANVNVNVDHNYIISDHSIVHVYTDHVVNSFQVKLSRGKLDFTEISNLLVEKDWIYSSTDINVVTNAFFDNLISTLDTVSPLRETKIKLNNKWMNDDCIERLLKIKIMPIKNTAGLRVMRTG